MSAVHTHLPPQHDPYTSLIPPQGIKLTPKHYAYLKISAGCNHRCSFCIIPSLRGALVSRPIGELGVWVRLHYVYPYPHGDEVIPLMREGKLLPYLDIPFQHASPRILKAMRRPAAAENTLARIHRWRELCPDITLRSTFIVGFPGETEQDFAELLNFLDAAQLDRVGCFAYSPVEGAAANALPDPVPEEVKQERLERFMQHQAAISVAKLQRRIGQHLTVLIDEVTDEGVVARSAAYAPEIDGVVFVKNAEGARPGEFIEVVVVDADEHDLYAEPARR